MSSLKLTVNKRFALLFLVLLTTGMGGYAQTRYEQKIFSEVKMKPTVMQIL